MVSSPPLEIQKLDPFRVKGIGIGKGKVKERLRLLICNCRRTFPHLDLLSRADVGEALSLFSRMLDELD